VLREFLLDAEVPLVVWQLTQLRHLSVDDMSIVKEIPDKISSLRQLTCLELGSLWGEGAPAELGECLPKTLEQLLLYNTQHTVSAEGLERLTNLTRLHGGVNSMVVTEHLAGLKELCLTGITLQPPFNGFSHLTGLEKLSLHDVKEGGVVVTSTPLPRLQWLNLTAEDPVRVAAQLIGSGRHLTHLSLGQEMDEQVSCISQLGVLPVLQELVLRQHVCSSLVGAGGWLQQQPHLTSVSLHGLAEEDASQLSHLPPQLEGLSLHWHDSALLRQPAGMDPGCLAQCLTHLTRLQRLLFETASSELPLWVSQLQRLESLWVRGRDVVDAPPADIDDIRVGGAVHAVPAAAAGSV
jgi:hypothetical protein